MPAARRRKTFGIDHLASARGVRLPRKRSSSASSGRHRLAERINSAPAPETWKNSGISTDPGRWRGHPQLLKKRSPQKPVIAENLIRAENTAVTPIDEI